METRFTLALLLTLGLSLSACDRPVERNAPSPSTTWAPDEDIAIDVAATDAAGDTAKSILRPDITPEQTAGPAAEPVTITIGFGTEAKLGEEGRTTLDKLLTTPVVKLNGAIILRGHSDSRGSDADNLIASRRRAEQVRDYLLAKGIEPSRIEIIALGETRPTVPNARLDGSDDPEGRARNRRVEVEVQLPDETQGGAT